MLNFLLLLTFAAVMAVISPGPTSAAPLALRVNVPLDRWKPVSVQQHPTFPPNPVIEQSYLHGRTNNHMSLLKPQGNNRAEGAADHNDGGDDDGVHDKTVKLKFRGMTLPRNFQAYDLDHSRGVSLAELARVTDTEVANAREPFDAADTDGNMTLSPEEFTQAPWIFDARGITVIDSDGKQDGGQTGADIQL